MTATIQARPEASAGPAAYAPVCSRQGCYPEQCQGGQHPKHADRIVGGCGQAERDEAQDQQRRRPGNRFVSHNADELELTMTCSARRGQEDEAQE